MKKMVDVLKNLDSEKVNIFLESEVKEVFISSLKGEKFQGWHHDITVDQDGELSITGQLSSGSMSMALYKGEEVCLFSLPSYFDWDFEFSIENIDLEYEEENMLMEKIMLIACIDEDDVENMTLDYFYWNYNCEFEEAFKELFENKYNNLIESWEEFEWGVYEERIIDTINENIANKLYYLENK